MMEYRRMGRTGLQLSALSFGSWVTFAKQLDDSLSDRLMGMAYDAGINFFDNAEVYSAGASELMMGRVLKAKNWERSSYIVSSKVFFGWKGAGKKPNQHGLSRKHVMEACDEALVRLQVEYLDLYYCHRPDPETPVEEVVRTMNTLIQQGKIFYWGTSEWSSAEIVEAHAVAARLGLEGPSVEQPEYNLFARQRVEVEYAPIFKNIGMGLTIWSPLASGLLTGKYNEGIPEGSRLTLEGYGWLKDKSYTEQKLQAVRNLQKISDDLGVTLASLSIAWCLTNPHVSTAILGATSVEQLNQNLKAMEVLPLLTSDVIATIESCFDI
jgi:voltage-dependent potassium channel beta subunit